MRLFVTEHFCSGALIPERLPASLVREGAAMLGAFLADAVPVWDGEVVTTFDARWNFGPRWGEIDDRIVIRHIAEPGQERRLFESLAAEADAAFIIAPESDGILESRRRLVDAVGGRFLGCTAEAIALCADKLALAEHLNRHRIPTIETAPFEPERSHSQFRFPIVVKPRDGAGSQNTFLVTNAAELQEARAAFAAEPSSAICQPFIAGLACSVAALVPADQQRIDVFPVGEQRLSNDGRFHYLGGRIPVDLNPGVRAAVETIVLQTCETIPGLQGYIGFDMIVPERAPDRPVMVEINPRLTTAYLGYRRLAEENLAQRMLSPDRHFPALTWQRNPVTFQPHGTTPECGQLAPRVDVPLAERADHISR